MPTNGWALPSGWPLVIAPAELGRSASMIETTAVVRIARIGSPSCGGTAFGPYRGGPVPRKGPDTS